MSRKLKWGRRRRRRPFRKLGLLLIFAVSAFIVYRIFMPNPTHIDPAWKELDKPIFFGEEAASYSASGTGDQLGLPLSVIQDKVDEHALYEESTGNVVLATADKLVHMKLNEQTAELNNRKQQLTVPATRSGSTVYVPAKLLEQVYGLQVKEDLASGAVRVFLPGDDIQNGVVKGDKSGRTSPLRKKPSIHAPILSDVKPGIHLRIYREDSGWYYAQTDSGHTGYIKAKLVDTKDTIEIPNQKTPNVAALQKWQNRKVNLTWEAVYQTAPKPANIGKLPGVNVVSPTWFELMDAEGNIKNKADSAYVSWAHSQGIQVWGLYSNSYNADLTTQAFASYETRHRAINQLLDAAVKYDLDGINLDFENVYTKDKEQITQFVRELRPLAHEQGLVVSIDVTPKSESELWSKFLDRPSLSEIADFIILMAYDEHWAASPVAGSVASLPWTEAAVQTLLSEDEVPSSKLILGVPLYTRVWSEADLKGTTKVSSKSISMDKAQSIIKQFALKPVAEAESGQNYVEYKEQGVLKKIWLEDASSLQQRVELAKKLNLAGIASWNRSFASGDAWTVLQQINE